MTTDVRPDCLAQEFPVNGSRHFRPCLFICVRLWRRLSRLATCLISLEAPRFGLRGAPRPGPGTLDH